MPAPEPRRWPPPWPAPRPPSASASACRKSGSKPPVTPPRFRPPGRRRRSGRRWRPVSEVSPPARLRRTARRPEADPPLQAIAVVGVEAAGKDRIHRCRTGWSSSRSHPRTLPASTDRSGSWSSVDQGARGYRGTRTLSVGAVGRGPPLLRRLNSIESIGGGAVEGKAHTPMRSRIQTAVATRSRQKMRTKMQAVRASKTPRRGWPYIPVRKDLPRR